MKIYTNLRGLTNLQLAIYDASILPRAVNTILNSYLHKDEENLKKLNNSTIEKIYYKIQIGLSLYLLSIITIKNWEKIFKV